MQTTAPTISSCTIVKNEEHNIDGLLDTLSAFADEIIIVDTGSEDTTVEMITRRMQSSPVPIILSSFVESPFHYGRAKNAAVRLATKEYIVMVDADFRLEGGFADGLRPFLAAEKPIIASYRIIDEYVPSLILTDHPFIWKRSSGLHYYEDDRGRVHEKLVMHADLPLAHFAGAMIHCQRDKHSLVNPQRILFQLKLDIDRQPKTASLAWHILRGIHGAWYKFYQYYIIKGTRHSGYAGFKYATIVGLNEFLKQLFIGLKATPESIKKLDARSPIHTAR